MDSAFMSMTGFVSLFPSREMTRRCAHSRRSARSSLIWLSLALSTRRFGSLTSDGSDVSLLLSSTSSRICG